MSLQDEQRAGSPVGAGRRSQGGDGHLAEPAGVVGLHPMSKRETPHVAARYDDGFLFVELPKTDLGF